MESLTLRDLRAQSGLSIGEIVRRMKAVEPTSPKFRTGLIHLEKRGTDRFPIIKALAYAYGIDEKIVEAAAIHSRLASKKEVTKMTTFA